MAENSNEGSSSSPTSGVVKREEEEEQIEDSARMVKQIMMTVLPSRGKITKEALQLMEKQTNKFISFVTTEANVFCKKEKREILEDTDVEWSLKILGLMPILDRYEVLDDDLIQSLLRQYNP